MQIRLDVEDRPGVLAKVAAVVAEHGVSIETVQQTTLTSGDSDGAAVLVVTTHRSTEAALAATVAAVAGLDVVSAVVSVLRGEGA